MKEQPVVSFTAVVRTALAMSLPMLLLLVLFEIFGFFSPSQFLYTYLAILIYRGVEAYLILKGLASLAGYVRNLALDKRAEPPVLGILNFRESTLAEGLKNLARSLDRKKQQQENVVVEREILVDTIPDALILLDGENHIVRTNRAARVIFGQNLAKKPLREIINNENLMASVYAVQEDMKGREIDFRISEPLPKDFRAIIERFPVPSAGGISTVITLTDITEIKRGEQMRADFVANASHEIRTPLASIIGFIETLQGPAKNDETAREQFLRLMGEQAQRMSRLVQDLLTLSKVEVDAEKPPMGKVDLSSVVRHEVQHFDWTARQKKMQIRLDIKQNTPPVLADEGELAQVVHNLLSNAIKYGAPESDVTISLRISSSFPNVANFRSQSQAVCLTVRDKGEGIPKEHIPRLTERFYRVDTARTRKIGGTGLGLAIVKHIVHRHRGVLTIDSVVGKGSVFSVYLPIYEEN